MTKSYQIYSPKGCPIKNPDILIFSLVMFHETLIKRSILWISGKKHSEYIHISVYQQKDMIRENDDSVEPVESF